MYSRIVYLFQLSEAYGNSFIHEDGASAITDTSRWIAVGHALSLSGSLQTSIQY